MLKLESPNSSQLNLAMTGGEGEESYAQNSRVQAGGFRYFQSILQEELAWLNLSRKSSIQIADLGCSSGPNTITQMNFIVNTLKARCKQTPSISSPDFEVVFVDLLLNDFNSLFRFIEQGRRDAKLRTCGSSDYYSYGVAGSFYGRLLSKARLDVVFSSFSLHWLSKCKYHEVQDEKLIMNLGPPEVVQFENQNDREYLAKIPDEVRDPDSPAFNSGFVWIHRGKLAAGKAYAAQAKLDMCNFLRARAEEMVSGGLMFLLLKGRKSSDPNTQYDPTGTSMIGFHMEEVFNELVKEKILDATVRDTFNVPVYYRTVEEMKDAVDEVDNFLVKRIEQLDEVPGNSSTPAELQASPSDCGKRVAKMCRCLLGVLIESHMGKEVTDEFFHRLEQRAIKRSEDEARENRVVRLDVNLAVLIRK